jgi:O-antigen/teichoic acid export membrane protein
MIKKIMETISARLLHALINFFILVIISRSLGSEGLGVLGLIILNVTLILMFVDLVGGGALIYFTPKKNDRALWLISILWALFAITIIIIMGSSLESFPFFKEHVLTNGYWSYTIFLVLAMTINQINYSFLIGKQMISEYSLIYSIHIILLLFGVLILFYGFEIISVESFIIAEYIALLISILIGWFFLLPVFDKKESCEYIPLFKEMFHYSVFGQSSNALTIFNKRFSFYVINSSFGLASLGVFNIAVQLTEGLRLIGSSISTVQYSRIVNEGDTNTSITLTLTLLKLTILITSLALLLLLLLPNVFYIRLFGEEFSEIKIVILSLSSGVVALSGNMILSHFFSGIGLPKYTFWASFLGVIVTIIFLFYLIPIYGYVGAGITASIAYSTSFVYLLYSFMLRSKLSFSDLLITKNDVALLKAKMTKLLQ